MRIAYITTYQGPTLLERRPIVQNRSLSNAVKIEMIATLLRAKGHDVEVISQGEVVERKFKYYPGFMEPKRFQADVPVYYASALPIRHLNALWSTNRTLEILKSRHRAAPFDVAIIFNLKEPQVACANYAMRRLHLPVIFEYDDNRFADAYGNQENAGWATDYKLEMCRKLMKKVSGCIGVSPHLLAQLPDDTPKLLLRGVVGADVVDAGKQAAGAKRDWVLFSGTHIKTGGVSELVESWKLSPIQGWELHITGSGQLTDSLRKDASNVPGLVFHGFVSRQELVSLMGSAKICVNPYALRHTPGSDFAFKVSEYLAAGAHCITTPMGVLEPDLEAGLTYMPDNLPETIARTLKVVIENRSYERVAPAAAEKAYGPEPVSICLDEFLKGVLARSGKRVSEGARPVRTHPFDGMQASRAQCDAPRRQVQTKQQSAGPLVSIIIPAHNAGAWIADAVQSAVDQTWPHKEIIVVDDGSTDGTREILRRFESESVRVIQQENQGAATARNRGLNESRGDYIQYLDADDLLAPDKIERQVAALCEGDTKRLLLSSSFGSFYYRTGRARFVETPLWQDLSAVEWLLRKMGYNLFMQTATWLTSRELAEAAGPWDRRLLSDDDGEYFCRVLLASEGTRFVKNAKVYYRTTPSVRLSHIGSSNAKQDALLVSLILHTRYLRSLEESDRVRRACLTYLQNWYGVFYPERPDLVAGVRRLASDLQGELAAPCLRPKYSWMVPLVGWKTAKLAQTRLPLFKLSVLRSLDKAIFEFESRNASRVHTAQAITPVQNP